MTYNFEESIEKLLQERGKTKKSLYNALGLTRQGFDNKLKNRTISVLELTTIARFFAVTEADLIAILANRAIPARPPVLQKEDYLPDYVRELEERFTKLADQLAIKDRQLESESRKHDEEIKEKNQQIAGLLKTVDTLAGKSEDTPNESLVTTKFKAKKRMPSASPLFLPQPSVTGVYHP